MECLKHRRDLPRFHYSHPPPRKMKRHSGGILLKSPAAETFHTLSSPATDAAIHLTIDIGPPGPLAIWTIAQTIAIVADVAIILVVILFVHQYHLATTIVKIRSHIVTPTSHTCHQAKRRWRRCIDATTIAKR
jgi:hypothetical protein